MLDLRVLVADNHSDTLNSLTTVLGLWGRASKVSFAGVLQ